MRLLLTILGVIFSVTGTCQIQNVWKLDNFRANSPIGDGVYNEVWGFVQNGQEYGGYWSNAWNFFLSHHR